MTYDMLSQHVRLGPFSLWLHDVFARKDIVLCPYTPFHLWALHFMYEDSLRAESFKMNGFTLEEKECNLFRPLFGHAPGAYGSRQENSFIPYQYIAGRSATAHTTLSWPVPPGK